MSGVLISSKSQLLPVPVLSSNFTMDEEAKLATEKQGIVSILGGGGFSSGVYGAYTTTTNSTPPPSLRRTLSADMSSKKWLQAHHNGFSSSAVKKISSSHQLLLASIHDHDHDQDHDHDHDQDHHGDSSSSDDDEDEMERLHIWNSIHDAKTKENSFPPKEEEEENTTSWISILSPQKKQDSDSDSKPLPPPYVHPLLKRSASALSQKSLEICTESLGSETGSDHGFSASSYPLSSEASTDAAEDDNLLPMPPGKEESYLNYNSPYNSGCSSSRKAKKAGAAAGLARSFPPPLLSLSGGDKGASLSMRSSRNNGRLVLEAVSFSSQNNFQAQRTEGRLILTFVDRSTSSTAMAGQDAEINVEEAVVEDEENNGNNVGEEEVEELEKEAEEGTDLELDRLLGAGRTELSAEKASNLPTTGVMNLHKLASLMMMNKPMVLPNRNPKWAMSKLDDVVVINKCKEFVEEKEEAATVQQSLPLQPQVARIIPTPLPASAASSFNPYEYFWRTKSTTAMVASSVSTNAKKQPLSVSALKSYGNNNNNNNNNCSTVPKYNSSSSWRNYYAGGGGAPIGIGKSCNEPRKCLFFWEANCITTSS